MGDIPANCDFLYVYPGVEVSFRKITLEVIIYIVISICLSVGK
jgi:ACR3 family arsenite efflux pump ArsB